MGRARVGTTAAVCLVLILASTLGLDWFHARVVSSSDTDAAVKSMVDRTIIKIDLRSLRACDGDVCMSGPVSKIVGMYPTVAVAAFWSSLLLAALVAFQAAMRLIGRTPGEGLNRLGYLLVFASLATGLLAGYIYGPDPGNHAEAGFSTTRTWAPAKLVAGALVAVVALYFAGTPDEAIVAAPVVAQPRVSAPVGPDAPPPPARSQVPDSIPLDGRPLEAEAPPRPAETAGPSVAPSALRGVLRYATASATLASIGIDATLEAGATRIVRWSEVVGIHARRLPPAPPFDGVTFVDVVSTAGATLRILPWTRLTGENMESGEGRMRAIVNFVAARCPVANIDRATRAYADGAEPARQLPDEATLAAHDEHLA